MCSRWKCIKQLPMHRTLYSVPPFCLVNHPGPSCIPFVKEIPSPFIGTVATTYSSRPLTLKARGSIFLDRSPTHPPSLTPLPVQNSFNFVHRGSRPRPDNATIAIPKQCAVPYRCCKSGETAEGNAGPSDLRATKSEYSPRAVFDVILANLPLFCRKSRFRWRESVERLPGGRCTLLPAEREPTTSACAAILPLLSRSQ